MNKFFHIWTNIKEHQTASEKERKKEKEKGEREREESQRLRAIEGNEGARGWEVERGSERCKRGEVEKGGEPSGGEV